MYNTFTHPIRRALLSLFFNDKNETGVTLYHNWVTYYGPKGIMPYFLKTEGPVALVRSRWWLRFSRFVLITIMWLRDVNTNDAYLLLCF